MSGRTFPPYGVGPAVWGPYFWTTMHIVSLGVSTKPSAEEQEGIRKFYESLQIVIPCPVCKNHYGEAIKAIPLRTESRDALVEWVYDIHNRVNEQLGKPQMSWEGFIGAMQSLGPPVRTSLGGPGPTPWLLLGIGLGVAGTFGTLRLLRR